ncbi:MAG: TIR domain-containing protein [Acidobacteriota bacterium]
MSSRLHVFISWSGKRSRALAELISDWLPKVIQISKPWMSAHEIAKGDRWSDGISRSLETHQIGIICVTPENYKAPWILFEAGALSKAVGSSRVCPLLLGLSPGDLSGPLAMFQSTSIDKGDLLSLIRSLNAEAGELALAEEVLQDSFENGWPHFEEEVKRIARIEIPGSTRKITSVIKAFASHGLPEPSIGSQAFFKSGFESHGLYTTSARVADDRLLIFGRKNRKFFDKEYRSFFRTLPQRIKAGFDFRVLFLDPSSPDWIIRAAHQDDDLREQIQQSLERAGSLLRGAGLELSDHVRLYSTSRTMAFLVVDDAVVFSPLSTDQDGRVLSLTKAPFTVLNSTSDFGEHLLNSFEDQWLKSHKP